MKRYLKIWGPVLLWMALIFFASSLPKNATGNNHQITFTGIMPIFPGVWEFIIKKSSHIIEYAILAMLFSRALLLIGHALNRRTILLAIGLTVLYATTDEFHQSFTAGRHASPLDIGIDLIGAAIGCGLYWLHYARHYPRTLFVWRR